MSKFRDQSKSDEGQISHGKSQLWLFSTLLNLRSVEARSVKIKLTSQPPATDVFLFNSFFVTLLLSPSTCFSLYFFFIPPFSSASYLHYDNNNVLKFKLFFFYNSTATYYYVLLFNKFLCFFLQPPQGNLLFMHNILLSNKFALSKVYFRNVQVVLRKKLVYQNY